MSIRRTLSEKSSDELLEIYKERNLDDYQPFVFDLIKEILEQRGVLSQETITKYSKVCFSDNSKLIFPRKCLGCNKKELNHHLLMNISYSRFPLWLKNLISFVYVLMSIIALGIIISSYVGYGLGMFLGAVAGALFGFKTYLKQVDSWMHGCVKHEVPLCKYCQSKIREQEKNELKNVGEGLRHRNHLFKLTLNQGCVEWEISNNDFANDILDLNRNSTFSSLDDFKLGGF